MAAQAKYENPRLFVAIARRIAASADVSQKIKSLFEIAAKSLDGSACVRAMESAEQLPQQVREHMYAAATRDIAEENRLNNFLEKTVGASPEVPPDATRH